MPARLTLTREQRSNDRAHRFRRKAFTERGKTVSVLKSALLGRTCQLQLGSSFAPVLSPALQDGLFKIRPGNPTHCHGTEKRGQGNHPGGREDVKKAKVYKSMQQVQCVADLPHKA